MDSAHRQLLGDARDALNCRILEREHGLLALDNGCILSHDMPANGAKESYVERRQVLPVIIESVVVELSELLF